MLKEPEQKLKINNKEESYYSSSPQYTPSFLPSFYTDTFATALTNALVQPQSSEEIECLREEQKKKEDKDS